MNAADQLIRFWSEMDFNGEPHVHPRDRDWLLHVKRSRKVTTAAPTTAEEWVMETRSSRVQLGLLPGPYGGDLRRADIIICLLNPGLAAGDFYGELKVPDFRNAIIRSIQQEFTPTDWFPFSCLDPQWCWTGGYQWWNKKFHRIILEIAKHHSGNYVDATSYLAQRIAVVELFPYHSANFTMHRALSELPSCIKAREFVQESIKDRDKIVIITRQIGAWKLADLAHGQPNVILYSNGEERSAHLSPGSKGGNAILEKLGIPQVPQTWPTLTE
ncbi:hypothetical protein [Rhizobium rhizogenes]